MCEIHCSLKTTPVAINISGHCYEFKKELQSNKKWCYYFYTSTLTDLSHIQLFLPYRLQHECIKILYEIQFNYHFHKVDLTHYRQTDEDFRTGKAKNRSHLQYLIHYLYSETQSMTRIVRLALTLSGNGENGDPPTPG